MKWDWKSLNPKVIREFRERGGKVARFGDKPVAILHTIDRRSGAVREVPLLLVIDDGQTLIFGTNAGSPKAPAWAADLREQPRIDVEIGTERFAASVDELAEPERKEKVCEMAASVEAFAAYVESAAPREVPVFTIRRLDGSVTLPA